MKLKLTERLSSSQTSKLSIIQVTEKIVKVQSISDVLLEVKKLISWNEEKEGSSTYQKPSEKCLS